MSFASYGVGIGNVGSYLVSGYPYITGSVVSGTTAASTEVKVEFPRITKAVTVINRSASPIIVSFDSRTNTNVINGYHYVTLSNQFDSFGFGVKCKELYISSLNDNSTASFEIYAELTSIDRKEMYDITGSGINCLGKGF